jgi:flavodoxin
MRALVIYDSNFGHTKLIAEEIAKNLQGEITTISVKEFDPAELVGKDLVVLGSPINGWRPTGAITAVLQVLSKEGLHGMKFTTFDTRVKLFIHGDAKDAMANALKESGAVLIVEPEAFYVHGQQGPLFKGELEKAASWAKLILSKM